MNKNVGRGNDNLIDPSFYAMTINEVKGIIWEKKQRKRYFFY
jgi:hypothetical protein